MEQLPVDCICCILAFMTSPKDICRLAGVSSAFRSAADSDLLWKTFLPADYREIIAQSLSSSSLSSFLNSLPEKALYFYLSDHPLLLGTGNSVQFDETLPPLSIRVEGRMKAKKLTPKTYYVAYFVFKFMDSNYSLTFDHSNSIIRRTCFDGYEFRRDLPLRGRLPRERADGWMEIGMGQILIDQGDHDDTLTFTFYHSNRIGCELIMEGIEIRPICKKEEKSLEWDDLACCPFKNLKLLTT